MRIPSVLVSAAAACCLIGSLTACSGGPVGSNGPEILAPSPSTSAPALDLAGTTWSVREEPGTTVHFDGLGVTVSADGRSSSYAWSAQGDQVLVGVSTSSLNGPVGATWLTSATEVARTADGWILSDAKGATTATLTATGSASTAPTTVTSLLTTAEPGSGVVDTASTALDGTWAATTDARSTITFTGGQWKAAGSCASGAVGGRGAYRVLPDGRLLVVRTMSPIRGCPITRDDPATRAGAITAIARAGSFRISGDTLTLFDRTGASLGSLVRA